MFSAIAAGVHIICLTLLHLDMTNACGQSGKRSNFRIVELDNKFINMKSRQTIPILSNNVDNSLFVQQESVDIQRTDKTHLTKKRVTHSDEPQQSTTTALLRKGAISGRNSIR